jgi:hypothetical protein
MPVLTAKDKALRRPAVKLGSLVTVDDSDGNPYFDGDAIDAYVGATYPTFSGCSLDLEQLELDDPSNGSNVNLTIDAVFDSGGYPPEYTLRMNSHLANIYQYDPLVGLELSILFLGG